MKDFVAERKQNHSPSCPVKKSGSAIHRHHFSV